MDDQTKKAVVAKNLENWYIIDSILFNAHAREVISEGKVFKEYVALKASLLSNLYEYWQHVQYSPVDDSTPTKVRTLQESAVHTAKRGKALASELMSRDAFKNSIKNHILAESKKHEVADISAFQDKLIQEKFKQFSIDNCLIGLPLLESKNPDAKCDFQCKILEEAHKLMRDNLVRLAMTSKKKV
jgi:predicted transposase YbfD/YdcC